MVLIIILYQSNLPLRTLKKISTTWSLFVVLILFLTIYLVSDVRFLYWKGMYEYSIKYKNFNDITVVVAYKLFDKVPIEINIAR